MIVCGLDLSVRGTGLCVFGDGRLVTHRAGFEIDRSNKALNIYREKIERLISLTAWVVELCESNAVDAVFIEDYSYGAFAKGRGKTSSSVTVLAELGGVVKVSVFRELKITAIPIMATSARATVFGAGYGRKKKKAILDELTLRGLVFPTNDEADAFVIAAAGYCVDRKIKAIDFWDLRPWQGVKR